MKPCTFQSKPKKYKIIHPEKISYTSGNGNPEKNSCVFSKESCSYVSGKGNPEKCFYILGNGTFLYFRKLLMFQELTFRARKMKKSRS